MSHVVVSMNKKRNLINRLTFEEIPLKLQRIESDCSIYYLDAAGERVFLAKYIKSALSDTDHVERRVLERIKGQPYGTYELQHDPESERLFRTITDHAHDIKHHFDESDLQMHQTFHFFYNKQMLVHRDTRFKHLRSLNVFKSSNVEGYFVFNDFDVYLDIQPNDLLLFDASQYHYMQRTNNKSEQNYRIAMNMI